MWSASSKCPPAVTIPPSSRQAFTFARKTALRNIEGPLEKCLLLSTFLVRLEPGVRGLLARREWRSDGGEKEGADSGSLRERDISFPVRHAPRGSPPGQTFGNRLLASVIVPRAQFMQMITMGQMRRNCGGSNDDHLVIVGITGRMVT